LKPYYILIELLDPISLLDRNFSLFNFWGGRARTCSLLIQSLVLHGFYGTLYHSNLRNIPLLLIIYYLLVYAHYAIVW